VPLPLRLPSEVVVFHISKTPVPLTVRLRSLFHWAQLSERTMPLLTVRFCKPLTRACPGPVPMKIRSPDPSFTKVPAPAKVWPAVVL